ncbi:MAG: hypothetical protein IPN38_04060 [Flavobacteriales bacterium]|nr:hypothetical protein [Flavobacteriales bacterium]
MSPPPWAVIVLSTMQPGGVVQGAWAMAAVATTKAVANGTSVLSAFMRA